MLFSTKSNLVVTILGMKNSGLKCNSFFKIISMAANAALVEKLIGFEKSL